MASSSGPRNDPRSLVIVDLPVQFIDREVLKNHFEQFGTVERVACSISRKYAVLHFSTPEEARNAEINGTIIRPSEPPLKIFNRAKGMPNISQKALAPPTQQHQQQPTRTVTKRKIVRNFGGVTVSVPNSPGVMATSATRTVAPSQAESPPALSDASHAQQAGQPFASTSKFQQAPSRSFIKTSRPSPYLRKKPSFGDKGGKVLSGTSVVPRNPFALPPRNMLSLDRRRKTTEIPTAKSTVSRTGGDSADGRSARQEAGSSSSTSYTGDNAGIAGHSAEIQLDDDDDQQDEVATSSPKDLNMLRSETESNIFTGKPSSNINVDLDESTEDATFDDDDTEPVDDKRKDPDFNPADEAEADTDTQSQDTAEVTTEEEGELVDNDEANEQDEEDPDDEPYESPLKRMERAKAESSSTTTTETTTGGFSFKLATNKASASKGDVTGSSSSTFKLPFSSPFSLGDSSKQFSTPAFGSQFGGSKSGTSIFAGSPNLVATASQDDKTVPPTKEKEPLRTTKQVVAKKELVTPSSTSSDTETTKPFTFFSSLAGSSMANIKSSESTNKPSLSGMAPSIFSSSKLSITSTSAMPESSRQSFATTTPTVPSAAPRSSKQQIQAAQSQVQPPKDVPNPLLLTFNPDTNEALELFSKRANTAEERYRILEARDKIIRARIPRTKVNVEFATKLVGTCPDMCPEKERYMRQFQRQLVAYEILPGGTDIVVDHQKAIKAYSRSSADQEEPLPHELRPGPTLDFTMHYLLRFIVPLGDNPDENLSDWYNFLWDRTRSIRKDITQQQIIDMTAVSLYEKCARFHIHCASRLCELDVHSFDPKLNDENLMKCIQSLEHLYDDLRRRQVNCPNEPEFRAYQIMMNLYEGDALYQAQQLPTWILNSREVQVALKLHHCIYTRNFVGFFRTVESLPYMTSCILHRYFFQIRSLALRCFIKAYCTLPKYETAMPLSTLQRMLGYGAHNGALSFSYLCEAHGIHCDVDEDKVILKRNMFYLPDFPSIYREHHLVDSKLQTSVAEAINGGPLPDFVPRIPHTSFNDAGQLVAGDVVAIEFSNENQPPATSTFIPPEISSTSKSQTKPGFGLFGSGSSSTNTFSSFSFGSSAYPQSRKDLAPTLPTPAHAEKPVKEIEAACKAATTKIIEESIQKDVTQLSLARLLEARALQEKAEKRRHQEQIATRLVSEYLDNMLTQETNNLVRKEAVTKLRQMRLVDELSSNAASTLLEESVLINLSITARTELILAREYYHRVIMHLKRIFLRIRARFAIEKWVRYANKKKLEREQEEERRREQLWNFPVINSYSLSTKDVFKAFCGRSPVQPSLNKVDLLSKSPEQTLRQRPKRKSDGDAPESEYSRAPNKLPRLTSSGNIRLHTEKDNKKINDLWEFPVIDSYSRTNREVLQAFCGSTHTDNLSLSPKINRFGSSSSNRFSAFNEMNDNGFFIRRPAPPVSIGRLSEEIRSKTSETTSDFLNSIQNFLSQVKEETKQFSNLEPYQEKVDEFKKHCPEVNNYIYRHETVRGNSGHQDSSPDLMDSDNDSESEWMDVDVGGIASSSSSYFLPGLFAEEDNLLSKLKSFKQQVKMESERTTWNTETFLNRIDLNATS